MSKFLQLTLRQKLLGGFLLCAVFTGLAGGAGILSLNQIQEKMISTTKDIGLTIEDQNNNSRKISELRTLVNLVAGADTKDILETARESLTQQTDEGQKEVQENEEQDILYGRVNTLIDHQSNFLKASDQLATLQKSTYSLLSDVTLLAQKTVDEIENSSSAMVKESLTDVTMKFEKMLEVTEESISTVKSAIMVPSFVNAINANVKETMLARDMKAVEETQKDIEGLIKSTRTVLGTLPKDQNIEQLEKVMEKLIGDFDFLVMTKNNLVQAGYGSDSSGYESLISVGKDCDVSLNEINKLATSTANTVESNASLKMDDMMSKTQESLVRITDAMQAVILFLKASYGVQSHFKEIDSMAKNVFLAAEQTSIDNTRKQMTVVLEKIDKKLSELPEDNKTVVAIKATVERLAPLLKNMIHAKKKILEAKENLENATTAIFAQLSDLDNQILAAAEQMKLNAEQAMEASNGMVNKWQYALILLGVSALVLAVFVGLFVSGTVTKPVAKAVGFAEKMSQGDFTQTLEIKQKDEIGVLAGALNSMVSNLGGMFKEIATGVGTLDASSKELSNISHHMSEGANNTSSKSNTVSAAAEEMSSNMDSVAATMEETATNVGLVASAAEQMTASINEIAQNTEKARSIAAQAVSESDEATEQINELGKAANEIGKVTEAITEISEQTNLLALNATIEAARAGEAGKGFAVVANEIKELARQTAEATGEIKKEIDGVQRSTEGTVVQIEQISKVINQVNEIVETIATAVEEQSVTTKEIAGNVVQASQGIQEVTQNVTQATTVTGEMTRDISEVNQASGEIANSSSQVNMSAQELSGLAEQLKEAVGRFKV